MADTFFLGRGGTLGGGDIGERILGGMYKHSYRC